MLIFTNPPLPHRNVYHFHSNHLADRDCIPNDVADLSNRMCIFVLTRGNGTPFNASSIMEEDVVEICVWLGHTHPGGVLQYSTIELVMLFHTTDELQVMVHGVVKASMLCKEDIRVRTSPPSATHVRAYIASINGEPSSTQPPPSNGEDEPNSSTSNPHVGGRTPQQLQANLGDLADDEWKQLMEDLHREVTLQELNAPPETHHQQLGEILWKTGILMWMTGRSPFQGEGGFPRSNHFDLLSPTQPDAGWEPRGQPPQPLASVPHDEDMGHLINTLAMGLQLGAPHINTFSGETMPGKMEVSL